MPKLRLRRGIIECITTALLIGTAHVALADEDAVTRAAVLSREAEKLEADGKISEACDKYAQSQALDPRGGTLLDEAICREKEGKTGTAFNLFVQAERVALGEKQSDRANTAKQHENALFAKLARLTVNVPKEAVTDGLEIDAGVQIIPQDQWGKPYPVDPGTLKVTASAPAKETWATTVDMRAGGKQTVTVSQLKPGAGPPPKPVVVSEPTRPTQTTGGGQPTGPLQSKGPEKPPAPPEGHRPKRVVADLQVLVGAHLSDVTSGPQSLIIGTQYRYLGAGGSEFLASCGLETTVPGAGSCKATYKKQAALLAGAQLFVGYGLTDSLQIGARVFGAFHYPLGFEVLGGPSLSAKVQGPLWMGVTALVGTSQVQATVTGAKGSVPDALQAANGGSNVTIGNAGLAGGLAGGNKVANNWATIEVGGSVEFSVLLADNKSGTTGSLFLSAWPYAVWSPGGPAFGLPIGLGYRFY